MPENELEIQCESLRMPIKLIDSFDFEIYKKENKAMFEPFRSRQRQEIIKKYLHKIIDLGMLKNEKLIVGSFQMHVFRLIIVLINFFIKKKNENNNKNIKTN